ncbi:ABC transporter permease subunit [Ruania albidiflava]|uniref:ABC transporter permease subunit n=1 Tax=Ruania albidiflava TaxID=366586 RepID=UPI0023F32CEB|nr:ABC transporter permease subunit [Ruania albidiflava]
MTAAATSHRADPLESAHLSFARVLRSEWIKFTTLRSTPWTIGVTILAMVGIALLGAISLAATADMVASGEIPADAGVPDFGPRDGTEMLNLGWIFGQIVITVLGVLTITGEYSTGQIRSTLAAVPTRLPVLWAKALLVAVVAFVTGLVSVAISYAATLPILDPHGAVPDLGDGETIRVLLGVPLYLTMIALFALGIGALLRHAAAGISAVLGLLLMLPLLGQFITVEWFQDIAEYFPMSAGSMITTYATDGPHLSPWEGFGVLAIYVVVIMAAAAVLLRRRDA